MRQGPCLCNILPLIAWHIIRWLNLCWITLYSGLLQISAVVLHSSSLFLQLFICLSFWVYLSLITLCASEGQSLSYSVVPAMQQEWWVLKEWIVSIYHSSPILKQGDLWAPLQVLGCYPSDIFKQKFACMYVFLSGGSIATFRFSKGFLVPPQVRNLFLQNCYEVRYLQGSLRIRPFDSDEVAGSCLFNLQQSPWRIQLAAVGVSPGWVSIMLPSPTRL